MLELMLLSGGFSGVLPRVAFLLALLLRSRKETTVFLAGSKVVAHGVGWGHHNLSVGAFVGSLVETFGSMSFVVVLLISLRFGVLDSS